MATTACIAPREPWNKGKIVGHKAVQAEGHLGRSSRCRCRKGHTVRLRYRRRSRWYVILRRDRNGRRFDLLPSAPTTQRTEHSNDPMRASD